MSLTISIILLAIIFAIFGFPFVSPSKSVRLKTMEFLRSKKAAITLVIPATAWFGYVLSQLGESDFGDYKLLFILIFCGAGLLSFIFLDDFLSVRGLSVLVILSCREFIDSAFMQEPSARLVMVTLAYILVVSAIYFGCLPYRMRDLFTYLYKNDFRAKAFGCILWCCSLALIISVFFC